MKTQHTQDQRQTGSLPLLMRANVTTEEVIDLAARIQTLHAENAELRAVNAELIAALQFVLADENSSVDYECGLIARAAISRATGGGK